MNSSYGEFAKRCRIDAGFTVSCLAKRSGVKEATIRGFENGRRLTNIYVVAAIADVLNVSIDEYIGREIKSD